MMIFEIKLQNPTKCHGYLNGFHHLVLHLLKFVSVTLSGSWVAVYAFIHVMP